MTTTNRLLFIAGSTRQQSFNAKLARLGATIAEANGVAATFADLGDYPMPLYNGDLEAAEGPPDNARKLKALMALHTGVFIASPEYNASITPVLKNTLDWISRVKDGEHSDIDVFRTRMFAIGAASPGGTGGIRGLNILRLTLELGFGALVLPDQVMVPRASSAFDENGHLKDKDAQERFKLLIEKLSRGARILQG